MREKLIILTFKKISIICMIKIPVMSNFEMLDLLNNLKYLEFSYNKNINNIYRL